MTIFKNIVTDFGAVGDLQKITAVLTIALNDTHLSSSTSLWVAGDVGKSIFVGGAGPSGNTLSGTIITFTDAQHIIISNQAGTALTASSQQVSWGTDNAPIFDSFNTFGTAQTDNIQLTIPSGIFGFFSQVGNSSRWPGGIKNLLVLGTGATLSDGGFADKSPQFQLGGQGQQNISAGHASIATISAGNTVLSLLTPSDASKFPVGSWVFVCGVDLQGGGFPLNNFFFEYQKVIATNSFFGTVTVATPLKNSYESTWPTYDLVGAGGPASIFALHPTWDIVTEFRGLTVDQVLGTNCVGRSISFTNGCKFLGTNGPNITDTQTAIITDSNASNCLMELDKGITSYTWSNTPVRTFLVQNSTTDSFNVTNTTSSSQITGTPRVSSFSNCTINSLSIGCFFGRSDQIICNSCSIATLLSSGSIDLGGPGQIGVQNAYTMSGGIITVPKSLIHELAWAQPGAWCMWGGQHPNQRLFQILDITDDAANTYVHTNQSGGFPSVPLDGSGRLNIQNHPCTSVTFTNCTGDPAVVDLSGQPANSPLYNGSRRTYSGDVLRPSPNQPAAITVWGNIKSVSLNVTKPYTGVQGTLTLQAYDGPTLQIDNSAGRYTPIVNLKTAGERIITSTNVTGQQTGDLNLSLPTPGVSWFSDQAFLGPNSSADISGENPSVWPIITITFILDQGIPPPSPPPSISSVGGWTDRQTNTARFSTSTAAAELGRLGGHARAKTLTSNQRSNISRNAAIARWK